MTVSSYLELYTSFIGWHFFSVVAELLAATGVIWLPLIFLIIESVKKARSSMHANAGAIAAYEGVETNAALMIIMMSLVLYPAIPFSAQEVRVTSQANCATYEDLNKTLATAADDAYPQLSRSAAVTNGVRVPVWWGIVLGLSGGVTHGVSSSLPCSSDLSELSHSLNAINVSDPDLREEYNRFVNECYVPAQSKIGRMENRPSGLQEAINNYPGDVYWPGGSALLSTHELYPMIRATRPVRGWPFREARDQDLITEIVTKEGGSEVRKRVQASPWGKPVCKEWWNGEASMESEGSWWNRFVGEPSSAKTVLENPNQGMKARLLAYSENEFGVLTKADVYLSQDAASAFDPAKYEEALIRRLVRQTPQDMTAGSGIGDSDEGVAAGGIAAASGAASGAASAAVAVGAGAAAVPAGIGALIGGTAVVASAASELAGLYAQVHILKKGLPFVQALLGMLVVMFLPFALVIGSYDLGTVIPASITLMAIKFFGAIWIVLGYLQSSLMTTMFPEEASFLLGADTLSVNALLIGLIFGFAHLGAIYVLFRVLGWGMQGANFGDLNMFGGGDMERSGRQAGASATNRAGTGAKVKLR